MKDDPQVSRPVVDAASEPRLQLKPDPPASAYLDGWVAAFNAASIREIARGCISPPGRVVSRPG
jgi:hypothetical protein